MVTVEVLQAFYDLKEHRDRKAGTTFAATEERAAYIASALPGYISYTTVAEQKPEPEPEQEPELEPKPDYESMPYIDLVALARDRGIQLKGRPKKAQLIEALSEE